MREFGVSIPLGAGRVAPCALAALEGDGVPEFLRRALLPALEEIEALSEKTAAIGRELATLSQHMPQAKNLMTVPGVGVLTATARERSSGNVRRMGRITKHGNRHLRTLMIHGARSVLRTAGRHDDDLRRWALELERRTGYNVAAVALANRLSRIAWRVWRDERPFQQRAA